MPTNSEFTQILEKIKEIRYATHENVKYNNSVQISGYVISKPVIKTTKGGKEFTWFRLIQITSNGKLYIFNCQTLGTRLAKLIKAQTTLYQVIVLGSLVYNELKKTFIIEATDLEILERYTQIPLLEVGEK